MFSFSLHFAFQSRKIKFYSKQAVGWAKRQDAREREREREETLIILILCLCAFNFLPSSDQLYYRFRTHRNPTIFLAIYTFVPQIESQALYVMHFNDAEMPSERSTFVHQKRFKAKARQANSRCGKRISQNKNIFINWINRNGGEDDERERKREIEVRQQWQQARNAFL